MESVDIDVEYLAAPSWDEKMPERLRWLRENDPVHWSEKDQLFVITTFEDVAYVSKNQQLFTSGEGVRPAMDTKVGLIDEGEPRHGQLRKLINRGFTPRMVKKLEVVFREITTEAIDAVASEGECDSDSGSESERKTESASASTSASASASESERGRE